ncbi:MAG: hypothetical protein R2875_15400 [Desulfobacterales bacterium]
MYELLTGPGLWLSVGICLIGLTVQGVLYVKELHWQLDRVAYRAHPKAGMKEHSGQSLSGCFPLAREAGGPSRL